MFGRKHPGRRSANPIFVLFRLVLSLIMLGVLLGGIYSAYKHFSGLDPLKLDPQSLVLGIMAKNGNISEIINKIPAIKGKWEVRGGKVDKEVGNGKSNLTLQNLTSRTSHPTSKSAFNFLMVADSHNDNVNLKKALAQAKGENPKFIIGLGDYSDVGTLSELREAKKEFDKSGLRYFLVVGDHDLWDSRNKSLSPNANFREVFGPTYQSFTYDNFRFILVYNSDNYIGMDQQQLDWLSSELDKAKKDQTKAVYVFAHEPLFHPSSDHVMGRVEPKLKQQAKNLIHQLKDAQVKLVFYGDIHYFSQFSEPETNLPMVTVGAITSDRNPQAPRFAAAHVMEDGNIEVEDIEIK